MSISNKKFRLTRKSFNLTTDNLDGLLVFDNITHKIYLSGECFSSNVKDVSFNQATGVITLTRMNSTRETIDLGHLEKPTNKVTSISDQSTDDEYPSAKCIYGTLERKGEVVWEVQSVSDGILASETDLSQNPTWQLTNLDMTPYQTVCLYVRSGGTGSDTTASGVIRINLASINTSPFGYFIGSTVLQNPNNRNRLLALSAAISKDKTKVFFNRCTSLYNTAATSANSDGRVLYKIVGYRGTGTPDPGEHTLVVVAPERIIGGDGQVYCMYDDVPVIPTWNITPTGPTINNNTITFDSSMGGTYTVTASYQGLTASKQIILEYVAGGSTDIEVNPDGSTTTTTVVEKTGGGTDTTITTDNPDGSSSQQIINENADGSSHSTTTNYDTNGDPTNKTTTDKDTSGNAITSNDVYDENGNEIRAGYNIDTTDNPGGGYDTGTSGVDSGVIAFDPDHPGFTIHAVLEFNPNSYGDNNNFIEAYDKSTKRGLYVYTSGNWLYKKVQTGNYTTNSSFKTWRELTGGNSNYYRENHITTFDIIYTTDKKLSMYVTGEGQSQRVAHFENFDVGSGDAAMTGLTVEVGKGGKTGIIIHELTVTRTGL